MWKTIKDHPNYEVCIDGRIRKKAVRIIYSNGLECKYVERYLKPEQIRNGYHRVTFSQGNKQRRASVHRVIAEHFLEAMPGKDVVNHKDGNKINNHADNLEWCTTSENELHSYRVLGKINPIRKLTDEQVRAIRSMKGTKTSVLVAMDYGVSKKTILNAWKYVTYRNA